MRVGASTAMKAAQGSQHAPLANAKRLGLARVHVQARTARQRTRDVRLAATYHGGVMSNGLKVAVVVAKFNSLITKPLYEGVLDHFEAHGIVGEDCDVREADLHRMRRVKPTPKRC